MKNDETGHSQDYDRKHGKNHGKSVAGKADAKSVYQEDRRETARHEHSHFTNRKDGGQS